MVKTLLIRLKRNTASGIDLQVWPDFVNVCRIVVFNNLLHHQFHPRRNAAEGTNVPISGIFGNGFHLLVPVVHLGNFLSRFVIAPKPKRNVAGADTAYFTLQKLILFLQIGAAAQHHDFLFVKVGRDFKIGQCAHLLDACGANGLDHLVGNGNAF